jgi:eukaryotic-like serine/threonine-protein kinase
LIEPGIETQVKGKGVVMSVAGTRGLPSVIFINYVFLPMILGLSLCWQPVYAGWKVPFDGGESNPAAYQGNIYIGDVAGAVYAIDPKTGEAIWKFQPGYEGNPGPTIIETDKADITNMITSVSDELAAGQKKIDATPIIIDGTVYVGSRDHNFYAINARTGKLEWLVNLGEIRDAALAAEDSIVVFGGPRPHSLWTPRIHVLNKKGDIRWSSPDNQIATYPAIQNGTVYYSLYQPNTEDQHSSFFSLCSSDLKTGKNNWVIALKGKRPQTAVITADRIYVTAYEGGEHVKVPGGVSSAPSTIHIYALDINDGKLLWHVTAGEPISVIASITKGNKLLFIANEDGLQAFDQSTGDRRWVIKGKFNPSNLLQIDQYLYAFKGGFGEDSTLVALSSQDGQEIWKAPLSGTVNKFNINEGVLYVTAGKDLFAFDSHTGKQLWKFTTWSLFKQGTLITTSPEVSGNQLIFSSKTETFFGRPPIQGYLYGIDLVKGK